MSKIGNYIVELMAMPEYQKGIALREAGDCRSKVGKIISPSEVKRYHAMQLGWDHADFEHRAGL